jgi:hypothetical protein
VLTSYGGPDRYVAVTIPRRFFNARMTNRGRRHSWFAWQSMWDLDLRLLPTGQQLFGDVTFFVPDYRETDGYTYIMLKGQGSFTDDAAVTGIPIGLATAQLCFLHTFNPGAALAAARATDAAETPVVFHYVVHYADGTSTSVPIRYGEAVDTWKRSDQKAPRDAAIAWMQDTQQWRNTAPRPPLPAGKSFRDLTPEERTAYRAAWQKEQDAHPPTLVRGGLAAYCYTWTNPHPEKLIATLDIVSDNTDAANYGAPALFAVSAAKQPQR